MDIQGTCTGEEVWHRWVGVRCADGEEGDERVVVQAGGDEEGRAEGRQANGENGTRKMTGRRRRRELEM